MKITPNLSVAGSMTQQNATAPAANRIRHNAASAAEPLSPISHAQQTLRDMPEVDMPRVAELKAAIGRGELDISADSLASTMMDYYRR